MANTTHWLDEAEQALWRDFLAVSRGIDAALARRMQEDNGISMSDYVVLVFLTESADGQVRSTRLAEEIGWERSRLSHHLRRMEQRGLIGREDCPSDRRGALIGVTDAGRAAIEKAAPAHVRAVRELLFDKLDADHRADLARILRLVRAGLD